MKFELGEVLTLTTGRIVGRGNIIGLRKLIAYMIEEPDWTNINDFYLLVLGDTCADRVLMEYPALVGAQLPEDIDEEIEVMGWLEEMEAKYGKEIEVPRIRG